MTKNINRHSTPLIRWAAFASLVAVPLACANVDTDSAAPDTEKTEARLLGAPGTFYSTAPSYASCGTGRFSFSACEPTYSFNSRGTFPTVTRLAAGDYFVTFDNQPRGGNPQIAVAGSARCGVSPPSLDRSGAGIRIAVRCTSATTGLLTDAAFILSYYQDTNVGGPFGGYAKIENPRSFPAVRDAWNSSGGAISVTSPRDGVFSVTFAGQSAGGDSAQVSALGTGFAYCTLGPGGWQGGVVDVRCFGPSGHVDNPSAFFVWYGKNLRGEPRNSLPTGTQGATMVVGATGIVDASRSQNTCLVGQNSAVLPTNSKTYTEVYPVTTASQGQVPLMGLVSAMSATGVYCNLAQFPIRGVGGASATVNCFTATGVPTTSTHSSMLTIQDQSGC
jgi:hypothetical protein